jgi:hypothetical protein
VAFAVPRSREAAYPPGVTYAWFQHSAFRRLQIIGARGARCTIEDPVYLERLVARIEALDPDGPMMKKFGSEPEVIELAFEPATQAPPETHRIINGLLQTPSTGFHRGPKPAVEAIVEEMRSLLAPKLGAALPLVVGTPLRFEHFVVTYLGAERVDHAPATLQTNTASFEVDADQGSRRIEVVSGQVPPAPAAFAIGGDDYTLFTYESPGGKRLYPHAFIIDRIEARANRLARLLRRSR